MNKAGNFVLDSQPLNYKRICAKALQRLGNNICLQSNLPEKRSVKRKKQEYKRDIAFYWYKYLDEPDGR